MHMKWWTGNFVILTPSVDYGEIILGRIERGCWDCMQIHLGHCCCTALPLWHVFPGRGGILCTNASGRNYYGQISIISWCNVTPCTFLGPPTVLIQARNHHRFHLYWEPPRLAKAPTIHAPADRCNATQSDVHAQKVLCISHGTSSAADIELQKKYLYRRCIRRNTPPSIHPCTATFK